MNGVAYGEAAARNVPTRRASASKAGSNINATPTDEAVMSTASASAPSDRSRSRRVGSPAGNARAGSK